MKKYFLPLLIFSLIGTAVKADFGDADFPTGIFNDGPKSYHDALCRSLKNKCRVRFQGPAMWVEGQGGIQIDQFISYRYDEEVQTGFLSAGTDYYNYISYRSKNGQRKEALFIFLNFDAHRDFIRAFSRWSRQEAKPIPNYRLPNSQGPQDTHGRDKGLNPYDNPPIEDWSIETNKKGTKGKINCNSPVWKKKPICN